METGICPAGVTLGFGITARLVRDRRAEASGARHAPDTGSPLCRPISVRTPGVTGGRWTDARCATSSPLETRPRQVREALLQRSGLERATQEAHSGNGRTYRNINDNIIAAHAF